METELKKKINESLVNGKLPCAFAFKIAKELKVGPSDVGAACNELNIKVSDCQLGCFK
jgi:hypothetical protein